MKLKSSLILTLPALTLVAASLQAAEPAPPPVPADAPPASAAPADAPAAESVVAETLPKNRTTWFTVITPRLFAFDYFDGLDEDRTQFLERYDYREGWSGDTRSDAFLDLDLDITGNSGERDFFVFERRGFGEHNHRGLAKYGSDALNVYGSYSHYRSATGGIDYLYRPDEPELDKYGTGGTAPPPGSGSGSGGGFATNFTDESNTSLYSIDRTTYSAGLKLKPSVLGGWATVALDYSGYQRGGNKFAPFLLDGGGEPGSGGGSERWRGINLAVDERMNRVGLTLTASPRKLFELAYEVSYEEFDNSAPELQRATGTPPLASLFYVADSNLVTHNIRASKNFNNKVMLAAGYGASWLEQDSFSQYETANGHTQGEVRTNNAYLTLNSNVSPDVSVEGYIKYYQHDNNSSFEDGLISTSTLVAPRISSIDSMDYGLSASWRAEAMKSGFTAGWRRLDRERDLVWGDGPQSIAPPQSLYREDTLSDEVYLTWRARPAQGWTTELKPSYLWSDKTGLVSEPEQAFILKTKATYTAPEGWVASAFYDFKDRENSNNTFTDTDGSPSQSQSLESTLQSAGLSLNHMLHENLSVYGNLYWMQDDVSSYLFTTTARRWDPVDFTLVDEPSYKIDSYVFNLGGNWDVSEKLKVSGSYTYTRSKGDVASGTVFTELQDATGTVDSVIDNSLHSFALGADYLLGEKSTLKVNYIFDLYDDNAYDLLNGGVHTLAVGVAFTL